MEVAHALTDVPKHTLDVLTFRSSKRAHDLFVSDYGKPLGGIAEARELKMACKRSEEYDTIPLETVVVDKTAKGSEVLAIMGAEAPKASKLVGALVAVGEKATGATPASGKL